MTTAAVSPEGVRNGEGLCSLATADGLRRHATSQLDAERQSALGQYFTSASLARFMAEMFVCSDPELHLLDAGAGVGSLTAAFVAEMCARPQVPESLTVTAFETDGNLIPYLGETMSACKAQCEVAGVQFDYQIVQDDFIARGVRLAGSGLFSNLPPFNCAILNPPYKKLRTESEARRMLSGLGIETSNLYSAFVWLAMRLLKPGGEIVAITPRSFCNGPYFRPFRQALQGEVNFLRLHVFDSRVEAFRDNSVLQENIVFHVVKKQVGVQVLPDVLVSSSRNSGAGDQVKRMVPVEQILRPGDPEAFINLVPDDVGQGVAEWILALPATLKSLRIAVSTGKVVDFRSKKDLLAEPRGNPEEAFAPLIYPVHFGNGSVCWPKEGGRKPNALAINSHTHSLLIPSGNYVLVKRFTSKEQKRRVVATVYDPHLIPDLGQSHHQLALENHLNYFHENGAGLTSELATGLAVFLNSTVVDTYFRQFNGHTQVNATDLRNLRYPTRPTLEKLGLMAAKAQFEGQLSQEWIDIHVELECLHHG